jgi:predicted lipid-binding transport protein (Tim44 family)
MSIGESGVHNAHWGPAATLNQLAGGFAGIAGGGMLGMALESNVPAAITGFCGVLYGVTLIVKEWIKRDGKHKNERISQLERELARTKHGEGKI